MLPDVLKDHGIIALFACLALGGLIWLHIRHRTGLLRQARDQTDFQAQLLENVRDAIIATDAQFRIQAWNKAAAVLYGWNAAEAMGQLFFTLAPCPGGPPKLGALAAEIEARGRARCECCQVGKDGKPIEVELSLQPFTPCSGQSCGWIWVARNITDRKLLQDQLLQSQKMESVGRLAAGIAHEINTPTQYVGDNTRFIQEGLQELFTMLWQFAAYFEEIKHGAVSPRQTQALERALGQSDLEYVSQEIPRAIQQSLDGIERISTIVRAMKEFSHPGGREKSPVDLNRAIAGTLTVARNELKYVAEVVTEFDPALPAVPCLANDFNQVILNLVVNAAHAIAEAQAASGGATPSKGTIAVSTRLAGDHAEIRVRDTGCGIPEAIRGKIFDPFFTTKPVGQGTGQGLAIARNVMVEKHGGSIEVESEVGKGTTFILRLPILADAVSEPGVPAATA